MSLRPGPGEIPGQALGPHRPYVWAWPGLSYIGPEARASGPQAQALTTLWVNSHIQTYGDQPRLTVLDESDIIYHLSMTVLVNVPYNT